MDAEVLAVGGVLSHSQVLLTDGGLVDAAGSLPNTGCCSSTAGWR